MSVADCREQPRSPGPLRPRSNCKKALDVILARTEQSPPPGPLPSSRSHPGPLLAPPAGTPASPNSGDRGNISDHLAPPRLCRGPDPCPGLACNVGGVGASAAQEPHPQAHRRGRPPALWTDHRARAGRLGLNRPRQSPSPQPCSSLAGEELGNRIRGIRRGDGRGRWWGSAAGPGRSRRLAGRAGGTGKGKRTGQTHGVAPSQATGWVIAGCGSFWVCRRGPQQSAGRRPVVSLYRPEVRPTTWPGVVSKCGIGASCKGMGVMGGRIGKHGRNVDAVRRRILCT